MNVASRESIPVVDDLWRSRIEGFPQVRYMGSKTRLLPWIAETIGTIPFNSALGAFSGSGAVSYWLKALDKRVIFNDFLNLPATMAAAIIEYSSEHLTEETLQFLVEPNSRAPDFFDVDLVYLAPPYVPRSAIISTVNKTYTWKDILTERLKAGRGSAIKGQARGSKQTDAIGDVTRILDEKRSDTTFLLVTDGITWKSRVNDLRKLVSMQNVGDIYRIYTKSMAEELRADLLQMKKEKGI